MRSVSDCALCVWYKQQLASRVQGLSRKGLHATAFEVAKLLLLLDPDDPSGALFCIDYFALRSQNLRWLQVGIL